MGDPARTDQTTAQLVTHLAGIRQMILDHQELLWHSVTICHFENRFDYFCAAWYVGLLPGTGTAGQMLMLLRRIRACDHTFCDSPTHVPPPESVHLTNELQQHVHCNPAHA